MSTAQAPVFNQHHFSKLIANYNEGLCAFLKTIEKGDFHTLLPIFRILLDTYRLIIVLEASGKFSVTPEPLAPCDHSFLNLAAMGFSPSELSSIVAFFARARQELNTPQGTCTVDADIKCSTCSRRADELAG